MIKIFVQSNRTEIIEKIDEYLYSEKIPYTKESSFGQKNTTEYYINYLGNTLFLINKLTEFGVTAFSLKE